MGKTIALGRATKAWKQKHSCFNNIINRPNLRKNYGFINKCQWLPIHHTECKLHLHTKTGAWYEADTYQFIM